MKNSNKFSREVRERSVRMVQEHGGEYPSLWVTKCGPVACGDFSRHAANVACRAIPETRDNGLREISCYFFCGKLDMKALNAGRTSSGLSSSTV